MTTCVIVGGTGLYLRALLDGLFESERGQTCDPVYREKIIQEAATHGSALLHDRLQSSDPVSAARIHPNDIRRIARALEVLHVTQKPLSALAPTRQGIRGDYDTRVFLLERDREDLYQRVNARVDAMLNQGLVAEVRRLSKKKLGRTASVALGLREIAAHLGGAYTLDEALDRMRTNTRHYARRQLSWFRHEKGMISVPIKKGEAPTETADKILKLVLS